MSSPFKIFRKHQKVLLVVAGLLAMIAFVILPIVLQNLGMRQGGDDPVVVSTTKYGDLTQRSLQNMRFRHECVIGFLSSVAGRLFGLEDQVFRPVMENILGSSSEREIVNRWLMDKKANEIGIHVSDKSISEFLTNNDNAFVDFIRRDPTFARYLPVLMQNKSLEKLTGNDFRDIFKTYQQQHITQDMLYDMLREELKVQEFERMFMTSIRGVPPGQRWDYYCRTHQQAQIECIAVPVAQFTDKIEKPDEKVLEDYFKQYKDNVANPYSPEPGFRAPQKIDIEYFQADLEKFAAPENVTDDEIQTYYEKDPKTYDEMNKKVLLNEVEKANEKKEPAGKEGAKKKLPKRQNPRQETNRRKAPHRRKAAHNLLRRKSKRRMRRKKRPKRRSESKRRPHRPMDQPANRRKRRPQRRKNRRMNQPTNRRIKPAKNRHQWCVLLIDSHRCKQTATLRIIPNRPKPKRPRKKQQRPKHPSPQRQKQKFPKPGEKRPHPSRRLLPRKQNTPL